MSYLLKIGRELRKKKKKQEAAKQEEVTHTRVGDRNGY